MLKNIIFYLSVFYRATLFAPFLNTPATLRSEQPLTIPILRPLLAPLPQDRTRPGLQNSLIPPFDLSPLLLQSPQCSGRW